ncbi:MAG TPA: glutathionylspermidine synthase family protein [Selenomonadales bacterium]|nr:glutathionylspermidine synthase family protein [Selenomonadales bacterium]
MDDYARQREQLYQPLREEGVFNWDWMYGREYALAIPRPITPEAVGALREAADRLGKVYAKTVAAVQERGDELLAELGLPPAALAAVRRPVIADKATLIGRFDFARTASGWKMLEFNSDTPGGIVEAFYVNGKVCDFHGARNPNTGLESQLASGFRRMVDLYRNLGYRAEHIWFSALDWHDEDAGTARYLCRVSGLGGRFIPLKDLRVDGEGFYARTADGLRPVEIWYRLHPLGMLAEDQDEDGYPTGAQVLELLRRRKLAAINPPGALIAQSKALQALIWGLYEAGAFFAPEELAAIGEYMLPTYLENRFAGRCRYVVKPALGREGGGIAIFDKDGQLAERDQGEHYWDQLMVYQQYQELEPAEVQTLEGPFSGRLMWGAFLIDGRASAVLARAGGLITDDLAYFVPVCLAEE